MDIKFKIITMRSSLDKANIELQRGNIFKVIVNNKEYYYKITTESGYNSTICIWPCIWGYDGYKDGYVASFYGKTLKDQNEYVVNFIFDIYPKLVNWDFTSYATYVTENDTTSKDT